MLTESRGYIYCTNQWFSNYFFFFCRSLKLQGKRNLPLLRQTPKILILNHNLLSIFDLFSSLCKSYEIKYSIELKKENVVHCEIFFFFTYLQKYQKIRRIVFFFFKLVSRIYRLNTFIFFLYI